MGTLGVLGAGLLGLGLGAKDCLPIGFVPCGERIELESAGPAAGEVRIGGALLAGGEGDLAGAESTREEEADGPGAERDVLLDDFSPWSLLPTTERPTCAGAGAVNNASASSRETVTGRVPSEAAIAMPSAQKGKNFSRQEQEARRRSKTDSKSETTEDFGGNKPDKVAGKTVIINQFCLTGPPERPHDFAAITLARR